MSIDRNAIAEALAQEDLGQLNELLLEASRMVLTAWDSPGALAPTVRELQAVVDAIDQLRDKPTPGVTVEITIGTKTVQGQVTRANHTPDGWDLEYEILDPGSCLFPYGRWKQWVDGGSMRVVS